MQLNILCCVGCFGCTKMGCYQDKDEIQYYGAEQRANAANETSFDNMQRRRINGSDNSADGFSGNKAGINTSEYGKRSDPQLLTGKSDTIDLN